MVLGIIIFLTFINQSSSSPIRIYTHTASFLSLKIPPFFQHIHLLSLFFYCVIFFLYLPLKEEAVIRSFSFKCGITFSLQNQMHYVCIYTYIYIFIFANPILYEQKVLLYLITLISGLVWSRSSLMIWSGLSSIVVGNKVYKRVLQCNLLYLLIYLECTVYTKNI